MVRVEWGRMFPTCFVVDFVREGGRVGWVLSTSVREQFRWIGETAHVESHLWGLHVMLGHENTTSISSETVRMILIGPSSSFFAHTEENPSPETNYGQKHQATEDTSDDGGHLW